MKCPQCGTEFEQKVDICFTCGWDFRENPADFTPRRSKLAIISLVLGILCLFTLYLPLLGAVIVGIVAIRQIRKSRGKLTGERLAMAGILIPLFSLPIIPALGYAIWSKDAGPVPNEFTEADYVQVRPENEKTYSILCQLNDKEDDPNGAPVIGLSKQDVEMLDELWSNDPNSIEEKFQFIRKHTGDIELLWDKSAKGRSVIEKLNAYDEIADLTEPSLDAELPFFRDIKFLCQINILKTLSLLENTGSSEACQQLICYDTFIRKYSVSARSLASKLVCYAVISMDIATADCIANYPNVTDEALLLLKSHYGSLNETQMSLKNCFIHEYLTFKYSMSEYFGNVKTPMYKHNSVCRYYDGFCRNLILYEEGQETYDYCQISVWPWEKPVFPKVSLDPDSVTTKYNNLYFVYNPIGTVQIAIFSPGFGVPFQLKNKILITDDLFQWVLARRMGQEGSLKARAYSDEYTVDVEKGLVFSVGPDGEPYTKDDIKLRIDPAVLGLK